MLNKRKPVLAHDIIIVVQRKCSLLERVIIKDMEAESSKCFEALYNNHMPFFVKSNTLKRSCEEFW